MTSKRNIDSRLNYLEGDGAASDTPTYDEQYCEAYQAIVEAQMRLPSDLRSDKEIDDVPTLLQTLRSCLSVDGTDEGDRVVARRLSEKATKTSENWDAVDQLCLELLHSKYYMDDDEVGEFWKRAATGKWETVAAVNFGAVYDALKENEGPLFPLRSFRNAINPFRDRDDDAVKAQIRRKA